MGETSQKREGEIGEDDLVVGERDGGNTRVMMSMIIAVHQFD